VVNCFNLDDHVTEREVEFNPEKFGLDAKRSYRIKGASSRATQTGYVLTFKVPALGHQLAEVRAG
jgi:hypothetical protein